MRTIAGFLRAHPTLAAWLALSAGMIVVLLLSIRGVGLTPPQTAWAVLATVGLAGACVWLVDRVE